MGHKEKKWIINEIKELASRIKDLQRSGISYVEQEIIIQDRREYAESIINTVREPLVIMDANLRVITASKSFYDTFRVVPKETEMQFIYDLGNRQWDIPGLRKLLNEILPENKIFDNYMVEHDFPVIGKHKMLLNARWIPREAKRPQLILLAIEDLGKRVTEEKELRAKSKELEICRAETAEMEMAIEGLKKKVKELEKRLQKKR